MEEVLCWCCNYFNLHNNENFGVCAKKSKIKFMYDNVCEDFLLLSGLHTKRVIPDYCKKNNCPKNKA